jgi:prepilin-type N-terminal cleavage/methylation domain-containing protein
MPIPAPLRRARLADQQGFTLIELLVGLMIGMLVLGGAVTVFESSYHTEPDAANRANDIQTARTTMERMVREIRQATAIDPNSTSQSLTMTTHVPSVTCSGQPAGYCQVSYTCTAGVCTRAVSTSPATVEQMVRGLSASDVFTYGGDPTNPNLVYLKLAFPPVNGGDSITLRDAVAIRNGNPG